jgi:lipid-A-disaccharide synthase
MRVLISAGEASGETYGAGLMEALQRLAVSRGLGPMEFFGLGGDRMRKAGCETVVEARDVAVVGIFEVASHLPSIYTRFQKLVSEAERRRPDFAVLIDFPDFNFRLAKQLHRLGIPVVYYVSPQLWAWRPNRVELVKKYVRKMLVIFPFEEQWYRERGITVEFVGHPLAEVGTAAGAAPEDQQIALLPGSRRKEIRFNLPQMLDVAESLSPFYKFVLPVASTVDDTFIYSIIRRHRSYENPSARITLCRDARAALARSRAAVVASGTATVEAAVIGTPFVMVYRMAPLSYALGTKMVKVPFYAMPNLIAGRQVVPELVQENYTAEKVVAELSAILPDGPQRDRMLEGLSEVRRKLRGSDTGNDAFERAAAAVLGAVNGTLLSRASSNGSA